MRAALYILIILSYFGDTEGCLFKPGHDVHGKWDDDDFTRDVDTSCGKSVFSLNIHLVSLIIPV